GARSLWRRSPRSSLSAGEPRTRRRRTGDLMTKWGGTRDAERRNHFGHHSGSLESRLEIERLTSGSEGGCWKSALSSNSPAAYPTSWLVWRGAVGKVLYRATRRQPTLPYVPFLEEEATAMPPPYPTHACDKNPDISPKPHTMLLAQTTA